MTAPDSLTLSVRGINALVGFETGGEYYYKPYPIWPGGDSGVTIGIGYDLGYVQTSQFAEDWGAVLGAARLRKLVPFVGYKRGTAKRATREFVNSNPGYRISWSEATGVFEARTLPRFARITANAFPGVEMLPPDAVAALVSLVYNRGPSMNGPRRVEMRDIRDTLLTLRFGAEVPDVLGKVSRSISGMKRWWEGMGLSGLLKRRDAESKMVAEADHAYNADEITAIPL
jgi:GH24 family phage-related lysozyme (muramidase)